MRSSEIQIVKILSQFNPWWKSESIPDLPEWKRSAFKELLDWVRNPPAHRAVMLTGPRQVGKTTLLMQVIDYLIKNGVSPNNILYVTFDHPVFKLAGLDEILNSWRELRTKEEGPEFLFLDEAQCVKDFGTWTKHQVDFNKQRRIVFTGSAMSLVSEKESGVGRWHNIRLATLSFYEYLQIKKIGINNIPKIDRLSDLLSLSTSDFQRIEETSQQLIGHFHEYLCRGGFPQTALVESVPQAQKLLREDIIDKVLKRDMTILFGVRRVLELEQFFIYLCMHDGGIQDLNTLSSNLGISKPTITNFIHLLESTHLLYRLLPFGYGKEVLRGKQKLYLADPAIAPSIMMKGRSLLEEPDSLGSCVETAVIAHLVAYHSANHSKFSYWISPKNKEVDLIVESGENIIAIEVKYQSQTTQLKDIPGLLQFGKERNIKRGFVVTRNSADLGPLGSESQLIRVPAPLFCYWMGESEIVETNILI